MSLFLLQNLHPLTYCFCVSAPHIDALISLEVGRLVMLHVHLIGWVMTSLLPLAFRSAARPLTAFSCSSRSSVFSSISSFRFAHTQTTVKKSQRARIERKRRSNFLKRLSRRRELRLEANTTPYVFPKGEIVHWQPPKLESWVINFNLERLGLIELPYHVFGAPIRKDIVHNVVLWQRAKRRQGLLPVSYSLCLSPCLSLSSSFLS